MFWKIENIPEFLASLDPSDEASFLKSWKRCLFAGAVDRVTDELLEAAFHALNFWTVKPTDIATRELRVSCAAVCRLITQAVVERPGEATSLLARIAAYQASPNIEVAGHMVARMRFFPEYREQTLPYLARIASSDVRWPAETPSSLRACAFCTMWMLDPQMAMRPEFRIARHECANANLRTCEGKSDESSAKSIRQAEEWLAV